MIDDELDALYRSLGRPTPAETEQAIGVALSERWRDLFEERLAEEMLERLDDQRERRPVSQQRLVVAQTQGRAATWNVLPATTPSARRRSVKAARLTPNP